MPEASEHLRELYAQIYRVVRKIPRGAVATYGQVAELAGIPGGARVAGAAMKTSSPADQLPWQRVIGKAGKLRGRIAIHDPVGAAVQRQLLEDEGIRVGETGLVALDEYGWLASRPETRTAGSAKRPAGKGAARTPARRARATGGSSRDASPRRPPRSASKRRASSSRR